MIYTYRTTSACIRGCFPARNAHLSNLNAMERETLVYDLFAVLGDQSLLKDISGELTRAKVVPLGHRALALMPMTLALKEEIEGKFVNPDKEEQDCSSFERLSSVSFDWLRTQSLLGRIGYVEAEFSGGVGGQSAIVLEHESVVFGPLLTRWGQTGDSHNVDSMKLMAINQALRLFGVRANNSKDEFDLLGLGKVRGTAKW